MDTLTVAQPTHRRRPADRTRRLVLAVAALNTLADALEALKRTLRAELRRRTRAGRGAHPPRPRGRRR